jgi:hypothetical protein
MNSRIIATYACKLYLGYNIMWVQPGVAVICDRIVEHGSLSNDLFSLLFEANWLGVHVVCIEAIVCPLLCRCHSRATLTTAQTPAGHPAPHQLQ